MQKIEQAQESGTTFIRENTDKDFCLHHRKRGTLCKNIAAFLSAPDVNLDEVRDKAKLTADELARAQRGLLISFECQKRILDYFETDLDLAGREDLGSKLSRS